jgi:hypothetical protein
MSDILWGAEEIGREANLLDENGDVDRRRVFYKLERGLLPAKKNGREWVSTRTAIRSALAIETAA